MEDQQMAQEQQKSPVQIASSQDVMALVQQLERANKQMGRLNSIGHNFLLATVRGLGAAVGATILTSLIAVVLYSLFASSLGSLPFFQNIQSVPSYQDLFKAPSSR